MPPTVAIEQRSSRGSRRSTVATLTEIYHYLRLLFTRVGTQLCPGCNIQIGARQRTSVAAAVAREYRGRNVLIHAPLVRSRKGFHREVARWAARKGLETLRVDGEAVSSRSFPDLARFKEHDIEALVGEFKLPASGRQVGHELRDAVDLACRWVTACCRSPRTVTPARRTVQHAAQLSRLRQRVSEPDPRSSPFTARWDIARYAGAAGSTGAPDEAEHGRPAEPLRPEPCPACGGKRLNPAALAVRVGGLSIADLTAQAVVRAEETLATGLELDSGNAGGPGDHDRDRVEAGLPPRGGAGLPQPGPLGGHPLHRRGPTNPPRRPAGIKSPRRALCARRAHHRPAPPGQPPAGAHAEEVAAQGKHGGGG